MDAKLIEELRQKYSKNPPEGMTSNLVKNMTMNLKKVFTSTSFNLSSVFYARFCAGSFYQEFDECRTFLLYKKKKPLTRYLLTHQQLLSCFVSVYYSVLQRFICFQHSP